MTIVLGKKGLTAPLTSGPAYFNYFWLRDNCPSSFDPTTRERMFDICALEADPVADSAEIENDTLVVQWRGEDHTSRFPLAWLTGYTAGEPRADPAAPARNLWRAGHEIQCFDAAEVAQSTSVRQSWAKSLIVDGIAMIRGMDDSDEALTTLANLLGEIRPSVSGPYFDVRVHLNPVNLSFTSAALELHTDTPAEETSPGVQFLHCRANSVAGGDSLFLDGAAAAEAFRAVHPNEFALLAEVTAPFYYDHDEFDWRSRQRVIELDEAGRVTGLTVSQHMADVFDMKQSLLNDYYPAFVNFMRWLRREEFLISFRLNAGDCIVFDNHRIVHGRDAYAANSGQRYLRGCYIDRGELRSTYRTLQKKADQ